MPCPLQSGQTTSFPFFCAPSPLASESEPFFDDAAALAEILTGTIMYPVPLHLLQVIISPGSASCLAPPIVVVPFPEEVFVGPNTPPEILRTFRLT